MEGENSAKKSPAQREGSNEDSEKSGNLPSTSEMETIIRSQQQANPMLPQLLPLQYTPDLAYSAYLLGYTGSLMAATRQYLTQPVLPSFGALPTPTFLQSIPMELNPLITSSESKCESASLNPKHGVKRPHEQSQEKIMVADNPIPVLSESKDILSLFNPWTVPSSTDPDFSSQITKTLSNADMARGSLVEKFGSKRPASVTDLTQEEKVKMNRDRNREHARSTRLRKKAYVSKLKELVDGLHVELSEDARKRRVASQHLAELQRVRRSVILSFLKFLASNQTDDRKLNTILEENFSLKQPVTPYRWFRQKEIDGVCFSSFC